MRLWVSKKKCILCIHKISYGSTVHTLQTKDIKHIPGTDALLDIIDKNEDQRFSMGEIYENSQIGTDDDYIVGIFRLSDDDTMLNDLDIFHKI